MLKRFLWRQSVIRWAVSATDALHNHYNSLHYASWILVSGLASPKDAIICLQGMLISPVVSSTQQLYALVDNWAIGAHSILSCGLSTISIPMFVHRPWKL